MNACRLLLLLDISYISRIIFLSNSLYTRLVTRIAFFTSNNLNSWKMDKNRCLCSWTRAQWFFILFYSDGPCHRQWLAHILIRLRHQFITKKYNRAHTVMWWFVILYSFLTLIRASMYTRNWIILKMTNTGDSLRSERGKKNEFTSFYFYLSESIQSNHNKIKITQITRFSVCERERGEKREFSNYCDWLCVQGPYLFWIADSHAIS